MNGGKGERSYTNNCLLQKKLMLKAKPILEETIMRLYRDFSPNCMKVTNLGCSVGPNALLVISNIIDIVNTACTSLNREPPKFQFYLNDLFGNGFNTIFKSLPNFYTRLVEDKGHKFGPCFVNATPGSFYGRLFPSNSINLFHSSNSLHWLSQKKIDKGHKLGSCFMNATPGSFHGRLFPSNSINFFLSANSLHWLSQVK
ncbi:3,7-dimethylxanthine N-methyltransferase [Glycine soja]|nr:3,7-dimethylxanthine N-methyltransferase [Glycine soja]